MDQVTGQQTATQNQTKQATTSPVQTYLERLYSGRMSRRNFFVGILLLFVSIIALLLLAAIFSFVSPDATINFSNPYQPLPKPGIGDAIHSIISILFILITIVWLFFFIINYFAFLVRRLHDLNKTGWFCLLNFVPFVSILLHIYLLFFPGTAGTNKYGDQPLPRVNVKQDILKLS
jgi:uncharacterized membrane protein YhaH (DUF805 family)